MRLPAPLLASAGLLWFLSAAAAAELAVPGRTTLYGTSTFPYAATEKAAEQTFAAASELSDIYVVQLDDGVPWREAAAGSALPAEVVAKWTSLRAHAPPGRPVYLALEPLGEDRVKLAPASKGSSVSSALSRAAFDDPALMAAYLAYARLAVNYFRPSYLNLGVENGELAQRSPAQWPAYARMIQYVMTELRRDHPGLPMGISFGLQSLMVPATAERARGLVEASDYIGISFYPYMSGFQELFGTAKLSPPPEEWRQPLDWLRAYTKKPIAITETGYNSINVDVPRWKLNLSSSTEMQAEYVRDLGRIAARDRYLFVVYYFAIDIGPLLEKMPEDVQVATSLWRENGLMSATLAPKPAMTAWRALLAQPYRTETTRPAPGTAAAATLTPTVGPSPASSIGFREVGDLCQAPAPAVVDLVDTEGRSKAMQWTFEPRRGAFSWCARPVQPGSLSGGSGMSFRIRSDVDGPLILELKTASNEGHYAVINGSQGWREVTLRWSDFAREGKAGPTVVDPAQVTKLVLADTGDAVPASGKRRVWLADWIVQ